MNPTHVHLLLNHVAIMAAIFSVLIYLFGIFRNNQSVIDVGMVGFVVAAVAAIPVFLTGEPAEESVESIAGVLGSAIESHEEAGELALSIVELTGVVALCGLVLRRVSFFTGKTFYIFLLIISLGSAATIAYTGNLGGKIRHTELSAAPAPNAAGDTGAEEEDDD